MSRQKGFSVHSLLEISAYTCTPLPSSTARSFIERRKIKSILLMNKSVTIYYFNNENSKKVGVLVVISRCAFSQDASK